MQQERQKIRPVHVGRDLQVVALRTLAAGRGEHDARIVDQDIEPGFGCEELGDCGLDGRQVGEIEF